MIEPIWGLRKLKMCPKKMMRFSLLTNYVQYSNYVVPILACIIPKKFGSILIVISSWNNTHTILSHKKTGTKIYNQPQLNWRMYPNFTSLVLKPRNLPSSAATNREQLAMLAPSVDLYLCHPVLKVVVVYLQEPYNASPVFAGETQMFFGGK